MKNKVLPITQLLRQIWICAIPMMILCATVNAQNTKVLSPDQRIALTFSLSPKGQPLYEVAVDGRPFINPSQMGFVADKVNLKDGFRIRNVRFDSSDETWTQIWGENKTIRNHYNEMSLTLQNRQKVQLVLTFRLFDDGIGFRYDYTAPKADSLLLMDELTTFALAEDGQCWSIVANFESYEFLYRKMAISQLDNASTPMTFKMKSGLYGSIHEAALTDFPEMALYPTSRKCEFKSRLAAWPDGVKARFNGNHFDSPWRTCQIAREAVELINSSLILNLNEPCKLEGELSWIRPMKYVGVWWGMHLGIETWKMDDRHGATTENAKRYIDFAAANNIDAVLFEGWNEGWETWGGMQNFDFTKPYADFDLPEILRYAREKGVDFISHHETGGNVYNYERQLEHTYQWLEDLGVQCVKTGYAGGLPDGHSHHGQFNVRHYRKVVETAARHHVTLDVHEPIKPTGIRRTYPNMMTREGARGMEWNAWSEGNPPEHHEILPFTRLLAGPMDYTPGTFDILFEKTRDLPQRQKWNDNDKGNSRVNTTLAKQLANWVILYSPLQMASDLIEHYEGHPAFQFFRDFNPDCDWSRALQGEIGEYVVVVRKAGTDFFLGATTNEYGRDLELPLDFLEEGKSYTATIYADAPDADWKTNPTAYQIYTKIVTMKDVLQIQLAPGGGQAIRFAEFQ